MAVYHITREHQFCVEADSQESADRIATENEAHALLEGNGLSKTTGCNKLRSLDQISDDLLDQPAINGDGQPVRELLNGTD